MFLALEPQCQLQNSRASAEAGLPKINFLQSIISIVEIQIVEGVENFRTKLITNAWVSASGSQENQIRIEKPRSAPRILICQWRWSAFIEEPGC